MPPPDWSSLDAAQCTRAAFNTETGSVRIEGEISVNDTSLPENAAIEVGGHLESIDSKITVTANGIKVDTSTVTQPISAESLPLPTDAATEAGQVVQQAYLLEISSKVSDAQLRKIQDSAGNDLTSQLGALDVGINVSGVQIDPREIRLLTASDTVSVVNSSLPTGAATSSKQDTGNSSLSSIDGKITTSVSGIKVDATATTQPVSAVALPLPSGASTAANQTASQPRKLQDGAGNNITSQLSGAQRALDVGIDVAGVQIDPRQIRALTSSDIVKSQLQDNTGAAITLGQKPSATSLPVVLPSDQLVGSLQDIVGAGRLFSISTDLNAASSGSNNPLILIRNPLGSGKNIFFYSLQGGTTIANVSVSFKIFSNPTITVNGTAITPRNRNVGSLTSSVALTTTLPTISVSGNELSGGVVGQNASTIVISENFSIKVQPGNSALITGNPSNNNRNCVLTAIWQEV